jgi:hypothetical protein
MSVSVKVCTKPPLAGADLRRELKCPCRYIASTRIGTSGSISGEAMRHEPAATSSVTYVPRSGEGRCMLAGGTSSGPAVVSVQKQHQPALICGFVVFLG